MLDCKFWRDANSGRVISLVQSRWPCTRIVVQLYVAGRRVKVRVSISSGDGAVNKRIIRRTLRGEYLLQSPQI